uniref:Uncharacterized protein n=1 Tax=Salix viminalis TaxID=40686 RepID=A0A6N2LB77_SALVM
MQAIGTTIIMMAWMALIILYYLFDDYAFEVGERHFRSLAMPLLRKYQLRDAEGYNVYLSKVIEIQFPVDPLLFSEGSFRPMSYSISRSRYQQTIFRSISYENAYKLIEMECGLMYDLL